jgi:hypothetical protein
LQFEHDESADDGNRLVFTSFLCTWWIPDHMFPKHTRHSFGCIWFFVHYLVCKINKKERNKSERNQREEKTMRS